MSIGIIRGVSQSPPRFFELMSQLRARKPECILLFSGGRDSTIAAIRLAASRRIGLVTVSSNHLIGAERVRGRVADLVSIFEPSFWLRVRQPPSAPAELRHDTCLPCQKS